MNHKILFCGQLWWPALTEGDLNLFGSRREHDYRTFFDALGIQGGSVPMADGEKSEYVRYVRITDTLEDRKRLTAILEQVLLRVPVYLIDETQQQDDPLVSWLLDQPAVHLGEKHTSLP